MKIGELFIALGFEVKNQKDFDAAERGMVHATVSASKLTLGVNAVNLALLAMLDSAMKVAMLLRNFSTTTGLSTAELQRWQQAAQLSGLEAQGLTSAVLSLQDARNAFALGEPTNVGTWSVLGVNPTKDPFTVLEQLRKRIAGAKDPGIARALLAKIGMEGMMPMLQLPDAEFARFRRQFIISSEQIDRLVKLNRQWQQMRITLAAIKNQLSAALSPALNFLTRILTAVTSALSAFTTWLNEGSTAAKVVRAGLQALAIGFLILGAAILFVTTGLAAASAAITAFWIASFPVTGPLLAITAVIGLVVAGIIALILLLDDLWTAAAGGKSAFDWSLSLKVINAMASAIERIQTAWEAINKATNAGEAGFVRLFSKFASDDATFKAERDANRGSAWMIPRTQSATSSMAQTNNIDIKVDGARSPEATGRAVAGSVKQEIVNAARQAPVPCY